MNTKHIEYQDEVVCCDSRKPSRHNVDPFFVPAELAQEAEVRCVRVMSPVSYQVAGLV